LEKKTAEKKERRDAKRQKVDVEDTNSGIQVESKRRKMVSIGECDDLATLEQMLEQPIARGKKQRVKKKIQALKNPQDAAAAAESSATGKKKASKKSEGEKVDPAD